MNKHDHVLRSVLCVLSHLSVLVFFLTVPIAEAQMGKPDGLYYKSWAIIIGTENYVVAPPLPGAVHGAKNVADAFRRLGFDEVVELYDHNTSLRRLHQVLNDMLPRKVGRMDRLVIFYVGHTGTIQDSEGLDRSYLVPVDSQLNNATKSITVEYLKEFTRRSAAKHTLLIFDAPVFGWETTGPETLSVEGRSASEVNTDRRVVQVISAASQGEVSGRPAGHSLFVQALVAGLSGAADLDGNGWLMASELGDFLVRQVRESSNGLQHPTSLRIDGDGDTVLVEGPKSALRSRAGALHTTSERRQAATPYYESAVTLLQAGKSAEEALNQLNRAIASDPTYGHAYVLKSYLRLELIPNLDEAYAAALLAVQYASDDPDSFYTLGLVQERRGKLTEAEAAFRQALHVKADYRDVYFSLGTLYADHLNDQSKSVEAFRRYLELGGTHARARAAVNQTDRTMP